MVWTADDIVSSVKRRAQLPAANGKLSDADILAIADEEVQTTIAQIERRAKEEFNVKSVDTTTVAGQSKYRIPTRAQGAVLRDVLVIDASDNVLDVPQIPLEHADFYEDGADYWWPNSVACAVEGDNLILIPAPTVGQVFTLRFRYYRRPSRLVLTSDAAVDKIGTVISSTTFRSATYPTNNHSTNDVVDLVQAIPNFDSLVDDATITINGNDEIVFPAAVSEAVVGDYVCDAGTTPIPQIIAELHPLLVRATLVSVLEAIGDRAALPPAQAKMQEMMDNAVYLINDRVEGAAKRIVNRNSPLRHRRWGYY